MPYSIHVQGLDGLTLLSPADPGFDAVATPMLGRVASLALRLKPFLVIVSNQSPRTVVSFSKNWRVTHGDGRTTMFREAVSFPHAVCGDALVSRDPAGFDPGARRIEANGVVIQGWGDLDEYFDQFLPQFFDQNDRLLARATELRIELNAAIFDDGTLVGPDDESWLRHTFSAYVEAKQSWYRGIIAALDAGRSVADAFQPLDDFSSAWMSGLRTGDAPPQEFPLEMWKREAAADAQRWRRRYADEEIPRLLKQSIRLEPFAISRP
jgi:hypothetical protein